eukprot:SAG31_NODE_47712_length_225_cov_2.228395_1_plen_35_part_01
MYILWHYYQIIWYYYQKYRARPLWSRTPLCDMGVH